MEVIHYLLLKVISIPNTLKKILVLKFRFLLYMLFVIFWIKAQVLNFLECSFICISLKYTIWKFVCSY